MLQKMQLAQKLGTPLNIIKILKNLTEKRYGAFKIWRGKKIQKISNCGQTVVKLIILEY